MLIRRFHNDHLPAVDVTYFFRKGERKREKPKIVSLKYIRIIDGKISSPIRRGARNYFSLSDSIIPGCVFYSPFCWINLLVVPSLFFSLFPFIPRSRPFPPSHYPLIPLLSVPSLFIASPFSIFSILLFPSFLPSFSPSPCQATPAF